MAIARSHRVIPAALALSALALAACSSSPTESADASLKQMASASGLACGTAPDPAKRQFVVGYGSLIEVQSRLRTAPSAKVAYPVEVKGFQRGWFDFSPTIGFTTTYLGSVPNERSELNGVVFEVEPKEIAALDEREHGYCRALVDHTAITELAGSRLPLDGQVWIFANGPEVIATATADRPIVQSYVDVVVGGCLDVERQYRLKGFARDCIAKTTNWSDAWVNDRVYPRRPFIEVPQSAEIDALLHELIPDQFARITIE